MQSRCAKPGPFAPIRGFTWCSREAPFLSGEKKSVEVPDKQRRTQSPWRLLVRARGEEKDEVPAAARCRRTCDGGPTIVLKITGLRSQQYSHQGLAAWGARGRECSQDSPLVRSRPKPWLGMVLGQIPDPWNSSWCSDQPTPQTGPVTNGSMGVHFPDEKGEAQRVPPSPGPPP